MNAFHPGTQIVKSRCNAFDIPPREKPDTHISPKKSGPKPSKTQQACSALDTPEERAARLTKKATEFHPMSVGTYPARRRLA